ncbi:MAG: LysR family transcriptional regulator [Spirochaetota bacterium]
MNTRTLRCFIEVYEKKSIAAAAKEVYISPQGLSKIIRQLEYDLDTELFYRGVHGMEPTEAAEVLYARARHIIYLLDDIKKEISILGGSKTALHMIISFAGSLIIPFEVLQRFMDAHPQVQLKIDEYPDEYPIHEMFQDEADVGLVLGHEGIAHCNYEVLVPGRTVVVVKEGHPLSKHKEISIQDIKGFPLILKTAEPGRDNPLLEQCNKLGITPKIVYTSGNLLAARRSCKDGLAVMESVDFIETAYPDKDLVVLLLKEKINRPVYFISRDREIQNRAVTLLQKFLREHCKR